VELGNTCTRGGVGIDLLKVRLFLLDPHADAGQGGSDQLFFKQHRRIAFRGSDVFVFGNISFVGSEKSISISSKVFLSSDLHF
jgi:hypothetical protein